MEILLKTYDGKKYVWKEATWDGESYLVEDETGFTSGYYTTDILAIRNDDRIGYVVCKNCGQLIKNDPESIEQHYASEEAKKDCLNCPYVRDYDRVSDKTVTRTPNGDGTYRVSQSYNTKLGCSYGYYTVDINKESVKNNCIHYSCRHYGMKSINDVFVNYPEPFVQQITVDALIAKKYPLEQYREGHFEYDMKSRGTLKACVNDSGIVDHFLVIKNGYRYTLYYSDKYNMLFGARGRNYDINRPDWMSDDRRECIANKISKLYKEANENDKK